MKWLDQMPIGTQITLGVVFHIAAGLAIGTAGAVIWFAIQVFARLLGTF